MKVSNESTKFVRYGMKVSYSEADYATKQDIPFGDPPVFLLEIIEPSPPGWIKPLVSKDQLEKVKPLWDNYLKTLKETGHAGNLRVFQQTILPPKKIRLFSETTLASLTLEKRLIPKDSSLHQYCKIMDYFTDDKRTLYIPIEASDENGEQLSLDEVLEAESYSFWVARLPDEILSTPYVLDATLEANYMAALGDNKAN